MSADKFANWKAQLAANIVKAIKELKADGVTASGVAGLMNCTKVPPGGPSGTNLQYMFANHFFPDALATLPAKYQAFIIGGGK